MKILVTGATGFVGGAITRALSILGHDVIATGRSSSAEAEISKYASFQQWDILKKNKSFDVDICIHSAGLADDQSSLKELRAINVTGTENLIDSIKCEKFIFISSSSVYNFGLKAIKEDDAIDITKLSNYGRSKREAELVVLQNKKPYFSTTILRPRVIYGIGDQLLIPRLIEQVQSKSMKIPGNLDVKTSMCSIELIIQTIVEIMDRHQGNDIFNINDSSIYLMKEVFQKTLNTFYGSEISLKQIPLSIAKPVAKISDFLPWRTKLSSFALKNLISDKILSNEKLIDFLAYKPKENYYERLGSICDWYAIAQKHGTSNLAWTNIK